MALQSLVISMDSSLLAYHVRCQMLNQWQNQKNQRQNKLVNLKNQLLNQLDQLLLNQQHNQLIGRRIGSKIVTFLWASHVLAILWSSSSSSGPPISSYIFKNRVSFATRLSFGEVIFMHLLSYLRRRRLKLHLFRSDECSLKLLKWLI